MLTCSHRTCRNTQSDLSIRLFGQKGFYLEDEWYCSEDCLDTALKVAIEKKLSPLLQKSSNLLQRPLLGLILLESALISREQLQLALSHQKQDRSARLGQMLQRLGFVKEEDITAALARQSGFPRLSLDRIVVNEAILRMIPPRIARLQKIFPIEYDPENNKLSIVMSYPDRTVVNTLAKMLRSQIAPFVGDETLLEEVIDQYYPKNSTEGNVEAGTFSISSGIESISREIIKRAKILGSQDLSIERCGQHLWVRITVENEAYNLFLSIADQTKDPDLLEAPLGRR